MNQEEFGKLLRFNGRKIAKCMKRIDESSKRFDKIFKSIFRMADTSGEVTKK